MNREDAGRVIEFFFEAGLTLDVGDEMFFGNDRLELVRLAVLRQTTLRPAA